MTSKKPFNLASRLSRTLRTCLLFLGIIAISATANAQVEIPYLDENGELQISPPAEKVDAGTLFMAHGGWFYVEGSVTINLRVYPTNAHIILLNGSHLTVNGGIHVGTDNTLTIYAQSMNNNRGKLTATAFSASGNAGIGGDYVGLYRGHCGTIIINGGDITATGADAGGGFKGGSGDWVGAWGGAGGAGAGAGIGGGGGAGGLGGQNESGLRDGSNGTIGGTGGNVTINGGKVTATGGNAGSGGPTGDGGSHAGGGGGGGGAAAGIGGGGGAGGGGVATVPFFSGYGMPGDGGNNPIGGILSGASGGNGGTHSEGRSAPGVGGAGGPGGVINTPSDHPYKTFTVSSAPRSVVIEVTYYRHTVAFDSQGGSAIEPLQNVLSGTRIRHLPVPTKAGYELEGWYDSGENRWDINSTATVTQDTTLYAKWTPVNYPITYHLNGGTDGGNPNPATYTIESNTIILTEPTKENAVFKGWYNNANFTGNAITAIPAGSMYSRAFWAKWESILQLPGWQIGEIPNQTVWHEGDVKIEFIAKDTTRKAEDIRYSIRMDNPPDGNIEIDSATGRFVYSPDKSDIRDFTVTFAATANGREISQTVRFIIMPAVQPDFSTFGLPKTTPPGNNDGYTFISQTSTAGVNFNHATRTVQQISISGKDLVFPSSNLSNLSGREDIEELNIFAERLVIREALHFKGTNVTIYAKELVFEDRDGVVASINTTPENDTTITNTIGGHGAKAGDINLYVKEFIQSTPQLRLIANGGNGQSVNANTLLYGSPGNGGKAGNINSTVNLDCFDSRGGVPGSGDPGDAISGTRGMDGVFTFLNTEFEWLHPNFVSAVIKHAKDAYLNTHNSYVFNTFTEYAQYFEDYQASDEWNSLDDVMMMELNNANLEMQAVLSSIGQYLDYFGNPVGWVPMLSFEVTKEMFDKEIDKAIRVMYLTYWLKNIDNNNVQKLEAARLAVDMLEQELSDDRDLINSLVTLIPQLQIETEMLDGEINALIAKIDKKTSELLVQAKDNVKKKNELNKVAGVLKAVSVVAPVIPGAGVFIGGAASIGNSVFTHVTGASDTYGLGNAATGVFSNANAALKTGGFSNISKALDSLDVGKLKVAAGDLKKAYDTLNVPVTKLFDDVGKLHKAFMQSTTPSDQVQAELNKIRAGSKEFQALIADAEVLNTKKEALLQRLSGALNEFSATTAKIQHGITSIDGLNVDAFNLSSKRDLRAMQYIDDMDRRAKDRLLKYHYYMAKAYEYRMLEAYPSNLDLTAMFDRFKTIAESGSNTLGAGDFNTLKAIYEEQISTVSDQILERYIHNRPEMTAPIRFALTKEDLEALNDGRDVILNIFERGMVSATDENARIVNFKVDTIIVRTEGSVGSFAYFDLKLEHSGLSQLRHNGEIYHFNHISNKTERPITWGIRYDALRSPGMINPIEPSFASGSLLYSLLGNLADGNIMIYSRPSVWGDIRISKNDITSNNVKMIIDSLWFELQYDFVPRPPANRNVDIYAQDVDGSAIKLTPYIELSRADITGRQNGRALMYRTYYNNTPNLTVTAPQRYGNWEFVNWSTRSGDVISTQAARTFNVSGDEVMIANYRYAGPALFVPDTIWANADDVLVSIPITPHIVDYDIDWNVRSEDSWLTIEEGFASGTNDGDVKVNLTVNQLQNERVSYIHIVPVYEGVDSVAVVIIQRKSEATSILDYSKRDFESGMKVYPNPFTGVIYLTGAEGGTLHVVNVSGTVVHRQKITTSNEALQLEHLPTGIYFLRVEKDGKLETVKVVKN